MSDSVLSVIPADPHWQPAPDAGKHAAALVLELVSASADGTEADPDDVEPDVDRHDAIAAVDCGQNLMRIGCPH